jgi:hypothetical protein
MLDIIECLQLFLDDEVVKKRLKLVMLVEEAILREALRNKYATALRLPDGDLDRVGQLVTDNLEKLFLCWLRLEPLRSEELREVFQGICDSLGPPVEAAVADRFASVAGPPKAATTKVVEVKTAPGAGVAVPPVTNATTDVSAAKQESVEFSLSDDERRAIVSLIDDIQFEADRDSWGPRAARCFVFRYQLARMLLNALGHKFVPHDLVSALAVAANPDLEGERSVDPVLFRIARQVS